MGIAVIGSTGSIGKKTLKAAQSLGLKVDAIVGYENLTLLKEQFDLFNPSIVGVINKDLYLPAKELFGDRLLCGQDALTTPCIKNDTQLVMVSVTGVNGLVSVVSAIKSGKMIALANKESLVAGGEIVLSELLKSRERGHNPYIIPVDSEHSAIFQCMQGLSNRNNLAKPEYISGGGIVGFDTAMLKRIILTASGGAFYDRENLEGITPKDISHPSYMMGRKITVDSCTLMNKALEIIEAYHLFGCNNIDYVIHPQSIIHSMIELCDGSVLSQLAPPDMILPISYALTYPNRANCDYSLPKLPFDSPLIFKKKNPIFEAPLLSYRVIEKGKSAGTIFNAANEAAVGLFEKGQILFKNIVEIVKKCLFMSDIVPINSIDDVFSIHKEVIDWVDADFRNILRRE